MKKVPKWLKHYYNEDEKLPEKYNHDSSVSGMIGKKKVTVWYKKWYSNILYQYKVNDFQRSPQLTQQSLEKRMRVIKGGE
jgi:hypothetical protein